MHNSETLDRKTKIEIIKNLWLGKETLSNVRKKKVVFVELKKFNKEPGYYYDAPTHRYNEQEKELLIEQKKKQAEICWQEVKVYD